MPLSAIKQLPRFVSITNDPNLRRETKTRAISNLDSAGRESFREASKRIKEEKKILLDTQVQLKKLTQDIEELRALVINSSQRTHYATGAI